ncbi:MAG: ABC transporter permease [Candidatus Poribacteria bacterium]|nr:MAG: ABC transporter permease [Candidatus Poribacteria bacterium]
MRLPEAVSGWVGPLVRTVGVILAALLLTLGLLVVTGYDLLDCLRAFWAGTFGTRYGWGGMLTAACPLLLTGLAVAIAFRCGALNIGAEGQFLVGALWATAVGVSLSLPRWAFLPLLFFLGALGGALWAAVAAALRVWRGVPEVLSTILLNFIAVEWVKYAVTGPLEIVPGTAQTAELPASGRLWMLDRTTDLHGGVLLAPVAAALLYLLLYRTTVGLEMRAVGSNPTAARYAGISVSANLFRTMLLSGGLAGFAGVVELTGRMYGLTQGSTDLGYGYTAIAVAMLARLHPLGVIASAWFFGALASGSREMSFAPTYVPDQLIEVVRGLMILLSIGYGVVELSFRKD